MVWWLVNSYFFTQIDGMMISEFLFFYPDRWYDELVNSYFLSR